MRYKLTISYDGSDFYGFQRQRGLISVQQCLEEALSTKLNAPVATVCAQCGAPLDNRKIDFDADQASLDAAGAMPPVMPGAPAVPSAPGAPVAPGSPKPPQA